MSVLVESQVMRRRQAVASLGLLAVLVVSCLVTDLMARNRGLERWLMAKGTALAAKNETIFSNTGNFIDFEDRVLLDEMPHADYSRGGVYFFGTSNMKWAFYTWDLPTELKKNIGIYGFGASSHTSQLRLIRYLIEQRGFLTAGKKDLVLLGVSFHLAHIDDPSSGYFAALLRRHGLYTITDDRITPVPMTFFEGWLRIEKARSAGFFWEIGRVAKSWAIATTGLSRGRLPGLSDTPDQLRGFMGGSQWQRNMDTEINQLRETIHLLRSHDAQVKVMLLPQGSWMDELPYKPRYEALIRALCKSTSTPLIDLSHAMPDDDFVDSNHLTVAGQKNFRDLIMEEILSHLRHAGLYSASQVRGSLMTDNGNNSSSAGRDTRLPARPN